MGMERLISLIPAIEPEKLDGYIVSNSPAEAFKLAADLRNAGLKVEFDLQNKKFTKQLEKASKIARYAFILGEDEIKNNMVSVKNLSTAHQEQLERSKLWSEFENV